MNTPRLAILGPQGAGKGTQASRLARRLHLQHIYPGQILRDEMSAGTALGKRITAAMNAGRLVTVTITNELIRQRLTRPDAANGWITDGYPRNMGQAKPFQRFGHPNLIIHLHLTDQAAIQRLSGRRVCPKGHVYHLRHDPPKRRRGYCDHDGLRLIQREDDTPAAIRQRLKIYHRETEPVLRWYQSRVLMITVDAHGSIKEVHRELLTKLKRIPWLLSRLQRR